MMVLLNNYTERPEIMLYC